MRRAVIFTESNSTPRKEVERRGVGLDGTEGGAFLGILAELPESQMGLARGAWEGTASLLLAAGKMGRGRE